MGFVCLRTTRTLRCGSSSNGAVRRRHLRSWTTVVALPWPTSRVRPMTAVLCRPWRRRRSYRTKQVCHWGRPLLLLLRLPMGRQALSFPFSREGARHRHLLYRRQQPTGHPTLLATRRPTWRTTPRRHTGPASWRCQRTAVSVEFLGSRTQRALPAAVTPCGSLLGPCVGVWTTGLVLATWYRLLSRVAPIRSTSPMHFVPGEHVCRRGQVRMWRGRRSLPGRTRLCTFLARMSDLPMVDVLTLLLPSALTTRTMHPVASPVIHLTVVGAALLLCHPRAASQAAAAANWR